MHRWDGTTPALHRDDPVDCADDVVLDSDIDIRKGVKNMEIVAVMNMCIAPKSYEEVYLGNHGKFSLLEYN